MLNLVFIILLVGISFIKTLNAIIANKILNVSIQKRTPTCQLAKNYVHFEQILADFNNTVLKIKYAFVIKLHCVV